jgi:hypothetical protein
VKVIILIPIQIADDVGDGRSDFRFRLSGAPQIAALNRMLKEPAIRSPIGWIQSSGLDVFQGLQLRFGSRSLYALAQRSLPVVRRILPFRKPSTKCSGIHPHRIGTTGHRATRPGRVD